MKKITQVLTVPSKNGSEKLLALTEDGNIYYWEVKERDVAVRVFDWPNNRNEWRNVKEKIGDWELLTMGFDSIL